MNIDPSLQSFLRDLLVTARGTFAKESSEEDLTNSLLLVLAGMGLARTAHIKRGCVHWLPTEKLNKLRKEPNFVIDLTPFMVKPDQNGQAQMTGSLRLIIEHLIATGLKERPELAKNATVDSTLLALAGQGLASFTEMPDSRWLWVASEDLLHSYYHGGKGINALGKERRPKIKMDAALEFVFDNFCKMVSARLGCKVNQRLTLIAALRLFELNGEAIAFKDGEGQLAWKAAGDLAEAFR